MNGNLAYQEEFREELINGEVVAMAPSPIWNHVSVADNLYTIFSTFLRGKTCRAISDGFDLYLTEKDIFIPDMMIVCDRSKIKQKGVYGAPDLVVEVLSYSTAKNDKGYKMQIYESCEIPEYWIVNPVSKSIEVYLFTDKKYVLDNIYYFFSDSELEEMDEKEKAVLVQEFKCHLYDDLIIRLEDIFCDLI